MIPKDGEQVRRAPVLPRITVLRETPGCGVVREILSGIQQAELRRKSDEYKNKEGRVLGRKVLHRRRTPEICRGSPFNIQQSIYQFYLCEETA